METHPDIHQSFLTYCMISQPDGSSMNYSFNPHFDHAGHPRRQELEIWAICTPRSAV